MTISAANPYENYTIVDSNAPLAFGYPFEFNDEIVVFEDNVLLDQGTDYSVVGAGAPAGGSVNPVNATLGSEWLIYRMTRLSQGSSPSDPIVGFALDRLTKQSQEARRDVDRSIKVTLLDGAELPDLPPLEAGKLLAVNEAGTGIEYIAISSDIEAQVDALEVALANETGARQAADASEANDRVAADNAEANARIAADNDEAVARAAADAALESMFTGIGDPGALRIFLDIENTNNTSDMNKPVSTAQTTAINDAVATRLPLAGKAADSELLDGQELTYVLALANATGTLLNANLHARLKEYATVLTDADVANTNGWYYLAPGAANSPGAGQWWLLHVSAFNSGSLHISHDAWRLTGSGTAGLTVSKHREYHPSAWEAWVDAYKTKKDMDAHYAQFFIQAGDPGAVGAGAIWVTP